MTEEKKTFTTDEVESIIENVRIHEQIISAMITAIQRSVAARDPQEYTRALQMVLDAQMPPQQVVDTPPTTEEETPIVPDLEE